MKSLNKALSILVFLGFGLLSSNCDKKAPPTNTAKSTKAEPKSAKASDKKTDEAGSETVTVAQTGTKFDPSIKLDTLPEGAWACVMGGKVHYARLEKGDGKCEICKMDLLEHRKGNTQKEEHDHDDHQH